MARMKQKMSGKKKFGIAVCVILVLLIAADCIMSVYVYDDAFNKRFESYEPLMLYVEDFPGLQREQYRFPSDRGQMLTGYMYSAGENQKGIVVMAHGFGGGGHNSYMDCADFFARHGYYVFAYDATGNDESEGEGVGGLPQGIIDLDKAITFLEKDAAFRELNKLPIFLFGHSWGGYSVCGVLQFHPEVKAVIEISGFNRSSDLFEVQGKKEIDSGIYAMMPFVNLYESVKFGKYSSATAMDGFEASDAAVMIIHSADDDIVPIAYGYDMYYKKYKDEPRFTFLRLEDRGHSYVYNDMTYINAFNAEFDKWKATLDYDYKAEENKERFASEKAAYIREHLDRSQWCDMLDKELFERFAGFYDAHVD